MSSPDFEVKLRPEVALRRLVLGCGSVAMLAGLILISHLGLPAWWRATIALVWLADCLRELAQLARGAARVSTLKLDAGGGLYALAPDGRTEQLTLVTGSQVLPWLAWLRVEFPDGSRHAELIRPNRRECKAWHGLQLIWQQRREIFGHPVRP